MATGQKLKPKGNDAKAGRDGTSSSVAVCSSLRSALGTNLDVPTIGQGHNQGDNGRVKGPALGGSGPAHQKGNRSGDLHVTLDVETN